MMKVFVLLCFGLASIHFDVTFGNENPVKCNDWFLAFRGTAGINKPVFNAYKDGSGIPANVEDGCKQVRLELPCRNHYRNNAILDNWKDISKVSLVIYKNNVKVKKMIFDGTGSNNMNWMSKERLLESSWTDLKKENFNFFSVEGHERDDVGRRFFINNVYSGCPNDVGWFVAIDNEKDPCQWTKAPALPVFKYSTTDTKENWNGANIATADYFAIFVRR